MYEDKLRAITFTNDKIRVCSHQKTLKSTYLQVQSHTQFHLCKCGCMPKMTKPVVYNESLKFHILRSAAQKCSHNCSLQLFKRIVKIL